MPLKAIIIGLGMFVFLLLLIFAYSLCVSANREDEYIEEYFKK